MGNPQYRQQWFETWLDNHRDIAPDVKIEFVQTKGTADIREKITMTALSGATDDLPDAAMLDPVTIQDLAKAGLLKDETEYLTPLIDKMVDGATTDATISGHIYALPDSVRPQVLFYNKAIFDEYGIDPEMMKTMDGYIEAGRQLKEKSNGEVYLSYIDPTSKTWRYWGRRGLMPSAVKVRVYEVDEDGDSVDDELIFEGHYRDGQSYERRKHVKSINIPVPTWDKDFNPHWAGFGMGFANFADGSLHVNDVDGVSLRSGNSLEYNLNVLEKAFPFSRYRWAVVIGAGMRWSRYRIDTNEYFKEIDGVTALRPAPEGVTLKASKLNITSLTIPLLLEWQPKKRSSEFFLSAGVVGVIKTCSSSKIVYNDASGKKHKEKMDSGMNIRPVTMDFLFQAGWDWIGLYAKYSPIDLFENGKGPKVHPVSIGLQLHL